MKICQRNYASESLMIQEGRDCRLVMQTLNEWKWHTTNIVEKKEEILKIETPEPITASIISTHKETINVCQLCKNLKCFSLSSFLLKEFYIVLTVQSNFGTLFTGILSPPGPFLTPSPSPSVQHSPRLQPSPSQSPFQQDVLLVTNSSQHFINTFNTTQEQVS